MSKYRIARSDSEVMMEGVGADGRRSMRRVRDYRTAHKITREYPKTDLWIEYSLFSNVVV